MTEDDNDDDESVRAWLDLALRHPSADLAHVTNEMGLVPLRTWSKGSDRYGPTGEPMPGKWQDSMWTYCWLVAKDESLNDCLERVVDKLEKHSKIFHSIRKEGGVAAVTIRIQMPGHIGMEFDNVLLSRYCATGLNLGFEVFD